jgi:hypothetical protein
MTCVWEANPACLGDAWDDLDADIRERSLRLATSSLQMLTYYRVGTCPITIRPCPDSRPCGCWGDAEVVVASLGMPFAPILWDGLWYNCTRCGRQCKPLSEVDIPGPVGYIDSVKVDGEELDLSTGDFRLDDGHLLVWQGTGPSPLPATQDLNKPDSAVGTWSITYSRSYPVGEDAQMAVAYLASEFAKACMPKAKCSLPRGVTNVVRNGVSFSVEAGLFPGGLTGIDIVDQFILKWAPAGSPLRNAVVFSPRSQGPRRTSAVPVRSEGV